MELLEQAKILLEKDNIRNYSILELLKTTMNVDIDIINESVFVRLKDQESFVMLSAYSMKDGEDLLARNLKEDDKAFCTIGSWPSLTEGKKLRYNNDCVQLYLPESVEVIENEEGVITLTEDMASYIHEHYDLKHIISEDYIRERIQAGPAFGVMDHGVLAGWAMTHDEGTMGILTVLPEYRRKGYARKLTAKMVKSQRALGRQCVVHVIKGNTPSLTLCKKSGMVYSCDVNWIVLE